MVDRTHGRRQGPITRLISPSDLGQSLKPFVFLDLFDTEGGSISGFGWHPHSGIATRTYLWEGSVRYEDTTGAAGFLPVVRVEWFKAAGGAWHGGGAGNSGRSRGFQLWLALPPEHELGPAESIYQTPQDIRAKGPAAVLLGTLGEVSSSLKAPSSINYLRRGSRPTKPGATNRRPITRFDGSRLPREGSLLLSLPRRASWWPSRRRIKRSTSERRRIASSSSARPIPTTSSSAIIRCTRAQHRFAPANSASPR